MHASRRSRGRRTLAVLVVATASLLAACGGGGDGGESGDGASGDGTPKVGGRLTLNSPSPSNLYPYSTAGPVAITGSRERFALFDALAVLGQDGKVQHRIATAIESDDDKVWTITLRDGVMFTDGTPFDAEAVKFNWTRMADPASRATQAATAAAIASMDVVDKQTLRVTLKAPNALFHRLVASSALAFIGSPTALQQLGEQFNRGPVGAGAFKLQEWVDGSYMRLVRNPAYYGESAYLDEIHFQYVEDQTSAYQTLQAGGIDVLTGADPDTLSQARTANYEVVETPLSGGAMFQMNTAKAPFDDKRAREAMAAAFDFRAMNAAAFSGAAEPVESLFVRDSPFHADVALLPKTDRAKAQRLFDELNAEGKPVEFTITLFADLDKFDDWLVTHLASFKNVKAAVSVVGRPAAAAAYREGNFQATLRPLQFLDPEPFLTDNFSSKGSQNYGKYNNPAVDAALAKARSNDSNADRKAAYESVQKAIAADIPVLFYRRLGNHHVVRDPKAFGGLPLLSDGLIDLPRVWKR